MLFHKFYNGQDEERFLTSKEKEEVAIKLERKNIKLENINFLKKIVIKDKVFLIEVKEEIKSLKILFINTFLKDLTTEKNVDSQRVLNKINELETFKNDKLSLEEDEIEKAFDVKFKNFKYSKSLKVFYYEDKSEIISCSKSLEVYTLNKKSKSFLTQKILKSFK